MGKRNARRAYRKRMREEELARFRAEFKRKGYAGAIDFCITPSFKNTIERKFSFIDNFQS